MTTHWKWLFDSLPSSISNPLRRGYARYLSAKVITHANLAWFTRTTSYYIYSPLFVPFALTDGTKYLAEAGKCHWLFNKIATLQLHPAIRNNDKLSKLQFWHLEVRADRSAVLRCECDTNKTAYMEEIPYTTFGLDQVQIVVALRQLDTSTLEEPEDSASMQVAFLLSEF